MNIPKAKLDQLCEQYRHLERNIQQVINIKAMREGLGQAPILFAGRVLPGKEEASTVFLGQLASAMQSGDYSWFGITSPQSSAVEPEPEPVKPPKPPAAEPDKPAVEPDKPVVKKEKVEDYTPIPDANANGIYSAIISTVMNSFADLGIPPGAVDKLVAELERRGVIGGDGAPDVHDAVKAAMSNGAFPEDRVRRLVREELAAIFNPSKK